MGLSVLLMRRIGEWKAFTFFGVVLDSSDLMLTV